MWAVIVQTVWAGEPDIHLPRKHRIICLDEMRAQG